MKVTRGGSIAMIAALMGAATAVSPSGQTVHLPPDMAPSRPRPASPVRSAQAKVAKMTRQLRRQADRAFSWSSPNQ